MSAAGRAAALALTLSFGLCAVPAFAQDAMPDMDMAHTGHTQRHARQHVAHPAKTSAKTTPEAAATPHAVQPMPDMPSMQGMDHHVAPADTASVPQVMPRMQETDHQGMSAHTPEPSSTPRSPDYSDGASHGAMTGMDMLDDAPLAMVLFDRLEGYRGRGANGAAFETKAWYGNDANKLWLKAEGETVAGRLHDLRVEALWDRPLAAFWDLQAGMRHDSGDGPDRTWAAFGVQGLAPYWLEVDATFYVGQSGRTALRFESEYELLLTQRLILQPRFEMNLYGRDDPRRGLGAGLSDAALGLRLRYEFSRQFAPYVGVEFERSFGQTARFARAVGEPVFEPRVVAGLRAWF